MITAPITRRGFVHAALAAGGALWLRPAEVGAASPSSPAAAPASGTRIGHFVRIEPDNRVVIGCRQPEIGQGVRTALPMLIAEELDLRWADVRVEQLPLAVDFLADPPRWIYGEQGAGGSTSISEAWADHRQFGADARALIVAAAAARWGEADPARLRTREGVVRHPDGRTLRYADVAREAAALPQRTGGDGKPLHAPLKSPAEYRIVGRPQKVVDARDIVTGRARYGLDSRFELDATEGALVVVMARCPWFEGGIETVDDSAARAVPGVVEVVVVPGPKPGAPITDNLVTGVAVVARDTWAALQGRAALNVRWSKGAGAGESSHGFDAQCTRLLAAPGQVVRDDGDLDAALRAAARVVEADYVLPFGAHAPMEPPNACVQLAADGRSARVVVATQSPGVVPRRVFTVTGIARDKVEVRMTRAGGGFGRRLLADYVTEAALVAKACAASANAAARGRPVQLMWTREDDLRCDAYRPGGHHRLRAALDAAGHVTGWHHKLASATKHHRRPGLKPEDAYKPELYVDDFPARRVPNLRLEWCAAASTLPRGSWRAPAHWANAFVVQSFIDEIAHAASRDALALRLALLRGGDGSHGGGGGGDRGRSGGSDDASGATERLPYGQHGGPHFEPARLAAVLERVAAAIGWSAANRSRRSERRGLGLAAHFTFGGYAAHAVQVQVGERGELAIERVVCAVDCGRAINPLGVEAQMEGGTIDGLAAALLQEITFDDGRVVQRSFADYPLLPLARAPRRLEVIVMPSERDPVGCGEMGIATVAPALANAIFNACGVRLRRLPFKDSLAEQMARRA
ncbi:MAG: xanthine dehydrogenase family protein molybdopterin-binding subunit [Rubrivivax sp.]|nr:xanthine dehydrogenase family protein molybdopterin-binding subunit [Rubrivivax sp.]